MIIFLLFSFGVMCSGQMDSNRIEDEVEEISETTKMSRTTTTTIAPPPDPFSNVEHFQTLTEKLDDLDMESQKLIVDYIRNGRKMNGDIRRRLILYVMKFSPVQNAVEMTGDPANIQKIERIKYRFRSGMKIKYTALQSRIDQLVAHLLAPIFAPFMLLEPDEIRPLFANQQPKPSNQFVEPITVSPQQMANQQSSFTALEIFPSSLPQDKWPQFDPRWFNPSPSVQFSVPSFTPFYQPFQYYRY